MSNIQVFDNYAVTVMIGKWWDEDMQKGQRLFIYNVGI